MRKAPLRRPDSPLPFLWETRKALNGKELSLIHIYDTVVRDSLKSTMDIEEKTYTALIGGITVIEFEDFREGRARIAQQHAEYAQPNLRRLR